jgi:hypothetical protein
MRVRDLKYRLSRTHGYSADELGRILDKKELIQALAFEEHKERQKSQDKLKRFVLMRGILFSVIAVVLVWCWPILKHVWEVAAINFVVYTDRKRHEVRRCFELKSKLGMVGVLLMAIFDVLQVWLSTSVILSWFMSSKYFFPMPNISVKPAQFMGTQVSNGPMGQYGLNVGPMVLTWGMRFVYGRIEAWAGRQFALAHREQRNEARQYESTEDRASRKAARKVAKLAAKEEASRQQYQEEQLRRRQAADQATQTLFPSQGAPKIQKEQDEEQEQQPTKEQARDAAARAAEHRMDEKARAEFQEQMEEDFTIDDLD